MNKTFLFSLGLLVVLSSLFVSCSDDKDGNNGAISCIVSVTAADGGCVSIDNYTGSKAVLSAGNTLVVVAVPNDGYQFVGWYVGDGEAPVSTDAIYTFIVKSDLQLVAKFDVGVNYNGYEYVDLGLPSGIKWAACNVGATAPEEYGCYYSWGETEEKTNYDWSTYKHCGGSNSTMTKYCNKSNFGTVDDKTVLDLDDDVAHVEWGGDWRMPTKEEQDELRDNCTWEWTTLNDVAGYRVTGPNGNSIFLPAAGYRVGKDIGEKGKNGYYWSSSLFPTLCYNAYALRFYNGTNAWGSRLRYYGQPVRAVSK